MMYLFFALTVHLAPRGLFFALSNRKKPSAPQPWLPVAAERESAWGRGIIDLVSATGGEGRRRPTGTPSPLPDPHLLGDVAGHFAPKKRPRTLVPWGVKILAGHGLQAVPTPTQRAFQAPLIFRKIDLLDFKWLEQSEKLLWDSERVEELLFLAPSPTTEFASLVLLTSFTDCTTLSDKLGSRLSVVMPFYPTCPFRGWL